MALPTFPDLPLTVVPNVTSGHNLDHIEMATYLAALRDEVNAKIDAATSAAAIGTAVATQHTADNGTYAPAGQPLLGPRWAFLGDSITIGASSTDQLIWGAGFSTYATLLSGGRIQQVRNAGVAGETSTQMLARFDADVTPYTPDVVFMLFGTNDTGQSFTLATIQSNTAALVAKCRTIQAVPVLGTIPPNLTGSPADRPARIVQFNAWLRQYATANNIPLVDFYPVLVDPATGGYKSGYSADGTHPQTTARMLMGSLVVSTLSPLMAPAAVLNPQDSIDPYNILPNGCFTAWSAALTVGTVTISKAAAGSALGAGTYFYKATITTATGESVASNEVTITAVAGDNVTVTVPVFAGHKKVNIFRSTATGTETLLDTVTSASPTVYVDNGSKTPGAAVPPVANTTPLPTGWTNSSGVNLCRVTRVSDAAIQGSVMRVNAVGFTGAMAATLSDPSKFLVGNRLAIVALVRTDALGAGLTAKFTINGTPSAAHQLLTDSGQAWGWGVFYKEIIVPASPTTLALVMQANNAAAGYCDFAQVGVYNLTAMGLAA